MELYYANNNFGFRIQAWKTAGKEDKRDERPFMATVTDESERRRGRIASKTIDNELTAIRSFTCFVGSNIVMADITYERIVAYERWMCGKGLRQSTRRLYLRSLRAVLNRCGADGEKLFSGVRTGVIKSDKRAISETDIIRIARAELPANSQIERARDLFMFSFLGMGMAPIDMAFLRKKDVHNGLIEYQRRKTGIGISLEMLPAMKSIVKRIEDPESTRLVSTLRSTEPQEAEREYRTFYNWYRRALARLSEVLGLGNRLTPYVARHTWASLTYQNGWNLAYISKGLGHANPLTTRAYLKEIDNASLWKANRLLIDGLGLKFKKI